MAKKIKTIPRLTPYTADQALEEAGWMWICGDREGARRLVRHIIFHIVK